MKRNGLTISQMAQLRGLTVDTLRHYDKIGLFKPSHVDPHTGYRYYSILQYEVLGTIKELRQIGMSIEEIKQFMTNRNVKQSLHILKQSLRDIQERIRGLQEISNILSERVQQIEEFENSYNQSDIVIKHFKEREYIPLSRLINFADLENLSYGFLELENKLKGIIPILASNKFGDLIKQEHFDEVRRASDFSQKLNVDYSELFILVQEDTSNHQTRTIKEGYFLCSFYGGIERNARLSRLKTLLAHCDQHGYVITGDAVQIVQIDISVTDRLNEVYYEIQIPIQELPSGVF